METIRFGFAKADITPTCPVQTVGFGRADETSRGVLDPLEMQATVWEGEHGRCCLMAIDHIGFSKVHANAMRDMLAQALGITREKVMLCFSHCHSAPNDTVESAWFDWVCKKALACAEEALSGMTPVTVGWGNAYTDIGANRRGGGEALDRRVGILKVCDGDSGKLRCLLLRLTVHCNVLKGDNYLISADCFGAVRRRLEQAYGCPVLVTQGASGNVAPRRITSTLPYLPDADDARFSRSPAALADNANTVYADTAETIAAIRPEKTNRLAMYAREIVLHADVPAYERAVEIAEEAKKYCGIDGTGWLKEVARLNRLGVTDQPDPTEIQFFAVGKGCLCGVANEIMCEFALEAAALTGNPFFYLGGYTNGSAGYFPTAAEFDQGGYEVYWSMLIYYIYYDRVFPLKRDSGSELLAFVMDNRP